MKCQAIKSDGTQCGANSQISSSYCFRHDPKAKKMGLLASSKGGQNRRLQGQYGTLQQLQSPKDIKNFIGIIMNSVWTGEIPVPIGSSLGFLARCWLDAHETSQMQDQLERIEGKMRSLEKK